MIYKISNGMNQFPKLTQRPLPQAPSVKRAIGVGIVMMGLAMGTGELILWPHLVTKWGLGLLWFALIGITFQYVINKEVARYTLATGESFFTGSARVFSYSAVLWLFAALLMYVWPGWASAIGATLVELTGFGTHIIWSWSMLALVLVLTFAGKRAYVFLERSLKVTVPLFFLLLLSISFFNLTPEIFVQFIADTRLLPSVLPQIDIMVLLGAIVFSGAGGMMNLAVSLWYRDKQLCMSEYAGRIENPMTGKCAVVDPIGSTFEQTAKNCAKWKAWMRYVYIDQGVIFWGLGFLTLLLLSFNAYAVLTPRGIVPEGLDVAVAQAHIFGDQFGIVGFKVFLFMTVLMLFSVMWAVIDATTRIISDIVYTNAKAGPLQKWFKPFSRLSLHHLYYGTATLIVIAGAILIPFNQPLTLLIISAVLGGFSMAIYTPLILYINNRLLQKNLRPGIFTNLSLVIITIFFWYFSYRIIFEYLT